MIPGWTILGWYGDLAKAREWARTLSIREAPIVDRFVASSVTLLSLGFLVLVGGIYLARRLPRPAPARDPEAP